MRGKVCGNLKYITRPRITPAHAGKRSQRRMTAKSKRDHPRPCGEKWLCWLTRSLSVGSPPPMRGKAPPASAPLCRRGITPAHAGKSHVSICLQFCLRDHPRPCGEKPSTALLASLLVGSPPPMRGKGLSVTLRCAHSRITPAHAGKSFAANVNTLKRLDHPRPCGEKA